MTDDPNPLLQPWTAPFGLPPFSQIRAEHFAPAFEQAMRVNLDEIDAIGHAQEPPSFDNTVAALDRAGRLLGRVGGVFYNLTSSETSPELQAVERDMAPVLAAHDSKVYMHGALFERIDALHRDRSGLGLSGEQTARAGAFPQRLRSCRRQARWRRAGPLCEGDAAPGRSDHAFRTERAGRRVRHTSCASTARPIWPACPTSFALRHARRQPTAASPMRM